MRLDYTLYILAAILLVITTIPFVVTIEGVKSDTRSLWVVTTVVLGLLSIGLGYSQRPKTDAQACHIIETTTQPVTVVAPKEEKQATPAKPLATLKKEAKHSSPVTLMIELTKVKGIGVKRATQLTALGISSANDLSRASAATIAKKLKVTRKMVERWIDNAKELVR